MKVNYTLLLTGLVLIALLIISWQADKGGRMGIYSPDRTFPESTHSWTPPARSFRSTGCCTDDVRSAIWNGRTLELYTGEEPIRLFLSNEAATNDHFIPGASDVLGAVSACGRVWLPETRHQRLLEVTPKGEYNTEVGSNLVGSVNGIVVVSGSPLSLVLTTGPRDSTDEFLVQPASPSARTVAEKLYVSRSGLSRPVLVELQPDAGVAPTPLDIGEELSSPSGIAASTDGKTLYVVDERQDELAWLRIKSTGNPAAPWASQGKIARFPIHADDARGIPRGLVVLQYGGQEILAGAVPGGLAFLTTDGHTLGQIATGDPISRVFPGNEFGRPLVYAVAGRTIWQARLHNVTIPPPLVCDTGMSAQAR
jgi:hypothetical protein